MTKTAPTILAVISTLPVIAVCGILAATEATATTCTADPGGCVPFVMTIEQVGSNVVATGSGEFDLTGLNFVGNTTRSNAVIDPSFPAIIAAGQGGIFEGNPTGPPNFGAGLETIADSSGGSFVGLLFGSLSSFLFVPLNYTSGTILNDTITFDNATIASLGITPGTDTWKWGGTGGAADQSFKMDAIAPTSVPAPATLPLFTGGLGALGLLHWRRKRKAQAAV